MSGKVVVVGSTNTDMTVRVPRIPVPGETVAGRNLQISGGGKGANQAVAAARAGAQVVFLTALGADHLGDQALASLTAEGIDVRFVRRVPGEASGIALIFVDDAGENVIAVAAGANACLQPDDVAPLASMMQHGDILLLQLEIPLLTVEAAARHAAAAGAWAVLNPAPARPLPDSLLANVTLITPNALETEQLTGIVPADDETLRQAAAALHGRGIRDVLITLGSGGAFASERDLSVSGLLPGFKVDALDTTAAGDVFNGALATALVEGRGPRDAISFANAAAAISVTRPGAQASAPRRAEIDAFLRERYELDE